MTIWHGGDVRGTDGEKQWRKIGLLELFQIGQVLQTTRGAFVIQQDNALHHRLTTE
jgi:hypothetical protein